MIEKETPKLRYLIRMAGAHTISFRMFAKLLLLAGIVAHLVMGYDKTETFVGNLEQLFPSIISNGSFAASGQELPEVYDSFMNPKNLGIRL